MKYSLNLFLIVWIIVAIIVGCLGLVSWWVIGLIGLSHFKLMVEWKK